VYRRGFEAALRAEVAGKPYTEAVEYVRGRDADVYDTDTYRRGYARGRAYLQGRADNPQT